MATIRDLILSFIILLIFVSANATEQAIKVSIKLHRNIYTYEEVERMNLSEYQNTIITILK